MLPLPPAPTEPGAGAYLSLDASGAVLGVPARDFRVQALLVVPLLPVAWAGIGLLLGLALPPRAAVPVGGGVLCLGTALSTPIGLVMLLLAPRNAARTQVRLDADRGLVLAGGRRIAPGELTALRIGQARPLMKWQGLLGQTARGEVLILGRVPPSRRPALVAVGRWLGEALGLPVEVAPIELGMPATTAAAACYFPLQGIWLFFSVGSLLLARDAQVRFAAKQSLSFYLLSGALLVALVLPLVAVVALLPERIGPAVGGAGVLLLVVPLALLRLGIGLLASWRAHKGQAWLIPGLGWLSRRWLPGP